MTTIGRFVKTSLVGLSILGSATPLYAQEHAQESDSVHRGFYLSAGYTMMYAPDDNLDFTSSTTINTTTGTNIGTTFLDYDLGFRSASLAAGYSFENGWRAELEASYRRNELEVIEFSDDRGVLNTGANDAVDAFNGFANLYYDFSTRLPIQPYLGIGAGVTSVGYKGNFSVLTGFMRSESPLFDDRDTAFAWQVIAGASLAFTPRTRLSAEYRYWRTGTLNFSSDQTPIQTDYQTQHELHMAGLTLQFFPGANKTTAHKRFADHAIAPQERPQETGWYSSAHFGAVAAEDSDVDDNSLDTNFDAFDLGPGGGVALGYQWRSKRGRNLRAELEASAFRNEADLVDFSFIIGEFRLRGDARTRTLAVNFIMERSRRRGIYPFAGIGLGYAEVDYDVELTEPQASFPDLEFLNGRASSPTVQGLLGVRVAATERLSLSLSYRYWWAPLLRLRNPRDERIETEHSAHMLHLGLQWRWSQPG